MIFVGRTAVHWHRVRENIVSKHGRPGSLANVVRNLNVTVRWPRWLRVKTLELGRRDLDVLLWVVILARMGHVSGKRIDLPPVETKRSFVIGDGQITVAVGSSQVRPVGALGLSKFKIALYPCNLLCLVLPVASLAADQASQGARIDVLLNLLVRLLKLKNCVQA